MRVINAHEVCDSKLEKPFRLIVGGGSGSGKTEFVKKLVDRNHFSSPFDKMLYCYPDYLDEAPVEFDQIVEYQPGLLDLQYFSKIPKNSLVILDDMMSECGQSDEIMKLFSVVARKRNLSIIFIVQNVYDRTKQFRNIRMNATGFILFKFYAATDVTQRLLRDLSCTRYINRKQSEKIYSKNFAYILIDVHPKRQSEFVTIRTNIFDKNFTVIHKMEYVAIPKEDFIKYFKVLEAKKGTIKAVKNEIEIGKNVRDRKSRKRSKRYHPYESETSNTSSRGSSSDSE